MSPNKWLLSFTIAFAGCDEAAQDAADEAEDTAVDNVMDSSLGEESYGSSKAGDFGPENTWWHTDASELPSGLTGTGFSAGDTAHDFTLHDQNGDQVQLYQFYGQVAYPTLVIIGRDMTIIEPDFWPMNPLWLAELVLD